MPLNREVIRNYSEALLATALKSDTADQVAEDVETLQSFAAEEALFNKTAHFLRSSRVSSALKNNFLDDLKTSLELTPVTRCWLGLIARHNRFTLIGEMARDYTHIYRERTGQLLAAVRSAFTLTDGEKERIRSALAAKLKAGITIEEKSDPSLIAGIRVEVAGMVWDSSVSGALKRLQTSFVQE